MLAEIFDRFRFWKNADRIGPDIPLTHWRLHFKSAMLSLCKKKFKYFDNTAEVRPGAYIIGCSKIHIGKRVVIRPGTMLFSGPLEYREGIVIEDDVLIGSGVHIYAVNHRFIDKDMPIIDQGHSPSQEVILKKGCWIGANVTILPGVTIGNNAVVGAGSVVTKDVPDRMIVAGNPMEILKKIE